MFLLAHSVLIKSFRVRNDKKIKLLYGVKTSAQWIEGEKTVDFSIINSGIP